MASAISSKLNTEIGHLSQENQQNIRNVLNGVYLYFKHKGFTYEEASDKPHKSPYSGMFTKVGGSKDLNQLFWKLKVIIPINYGTNNQPVSTFSNELRDEMKSLARKVNGSYFLDSTNTAFYNVIGLGSDVAVEFGKSTDGSGGVYYDHNNGSIKIYVLVKVVYSRNVENKVNVDTSENHKYILGKIASFVLPSDKKDVLDAVDMMYSYVEKNYIGCVESKKIMKKEVEIDLRSNRYDDLSKLCQYQAFIWKTELKKSTGYKFNPEDVIKKFSREDPIRVKVDTNTFTLGRVTNECYAGLCHDYGSRGVEYMYFAVLKQDSNIRTHVVNNPFLSADGNSLKNSKVSVVYRRNEKKIHGSDLTDMCNMPMFYTVKRQGIDKAWNELLDTFDDNTSFGECMKIIGYDKVRSYCAMD